MGRKRPVEIHPETDQNPQRQLDALTSAGCTRVFVEKAFGAQCERPELQAALDYTRAGDTLVVWKLDRLARSTKPVIDTVEALEQREVGASTLYRHLPGGRSAALEEQQS
jgi:DNA invertase Pin-like site-specific DNA recombinase